MINFQCARQMLRHVFVHSDIPTDAWTESDSTPVFTIHRGFRVYVVAFARSNAHLLHLSLSVQRCGGLLNVIGARDDVLPIPEEFKIDDALRPDLDFRWYGYDKEGNYEKERSYRKILFKRLLFVWRFASLLAPEDIIINIDGNDVLFQRPLDEIVPVWQELASGPAWMCYHYVVSAGESNDWCAAVGVRDGWEYAYNGGVGSPGGVAYSGGVRCSENGAPCWCCRRQSKTVTPPFSEAVVLAGLPTCWGFPSEHAHVRYPLNDGETMLGSEGCNRWRSQGRRGTLPFLDSGGYMGRAAAIKRMLDVALDLARQGLDYICMTTLHVAGLRLGPSSVKIDSEARIFYSLKPTGPFNTFANWTPELSRPLCESGYFDRFGRPPAHARTGRTPGIVHFVGPAKWLHLSRCADTFLERRILELDAGSVSAVTPASPGFAGHAFPLCRPCPICVQGEWCLCFACYNMSGMFGYFDMDRSELISWPLNELSRIK